MGYLDRIQLKATRNAWTKLREWLRVVEAPPIRSMRKFAEDEIVISSGPSPGRFSCDKQPYSRAWFDLVDSGKWNRFFLTGCVQSGKTQHGFVIPIMYHLFEYQESVICLVPDGEMAKAKWTDIKSAVEKSRYHTLLPTKGPGSKGGAVSKIYFKNGTFLQFMTGKGSDKSRAGATARVVVITELDGMDEAGEASREADPVTQVEARTKSFGDRKRIYAECTTSIETGRTWVERKAGTETEFHVQCRGCKQWFVPEREDLIGWQDAENEIEAGRQSRFACKFKGCGLVWSEHDRQEMLQGLRPVHRGQSIVDGETVGDPPVTNTLSIRWNAFHNSFWTVSFIGREEWVASHAENTDAAEKERWQYAWTQPFKPDIEATTPVKQKIIMARAGSVPKGFVPSNVEYFAVGMDLGKKNSHWVALAAMPGCAVQVVEYGVIKVNSDTTGEEYALMECMQAFKQKVDIGWEIAGGGRRIPDRALIDSGYQGEHGGDVVYQFMRQHGGGRFWAADGRGDAEDGPHHSYSHPTQITAKTPLLGEQYHVSMTQRGDMIVAIHSNYWKSWVHKRLVTPVGTPGAMTLYEGEGSIHAVFANHLVAEQSKTEFKVGRGIVTKWERTSKNNHFFDALYYACVGLHMAGARLIEEKPIVIEARPTTEQERPFVRQMSRVDTSGGWRRRSGAET